MAVGDPVPGSEVANAVGRGVRNPPKVVPLAPLTEADKLRYDWRREFLSEPLPEQLEARLVAARRRDQAQLEVDRHMEDKLIEMLARIK
jgi:hypothetical protein